MPKKYDLVVVTGNYTNSMGEQKKQYKNVGIVNETDKGLYILLDRTFNPAGVPNPDNNGNVLISMFEPKGKEEPPKQSNSFSSFDEFEDEIPF
jgi:hypothetical protein